MRRSPTSSPASLVPWSCAAVRRRRCSGHNVHGYAPAPSGRYACADRLVGMSRPGNPAPRPVKPGTASRLVIHADCPWMKANRCLSCLVLFVFLLPDESGHPIRRIHHSPVPQGLHAVVAPCAGSCGIGRLPGPVIPSACQQTGPVGPGRSGTWNRSSIRSARRYFRIVLRDSPVRYSISWIGR
ncbi:hypothetical protein H845_2394 [Komagataeibacter xylinus E25]|nr:hypothetical protein H845_2394 [Komagataeibacter xylinus E25]